MVLLLFILLLLPGYVAARRLKIIEADAALLDAIAISSIASFGLLSPVSILCYALHLPVSVFSVASGALVIASFVDATRRRLWNDIAKTAWRGAGIAAIIVAIDLILSMRVGSVLYGDALVHVTRIRDILDHGFSNTDPFVREDFFYPIYHTNILYSVLAMFSWVTHSEPVEVWFDALPCAKLLIWSSVFFAANTIFGSRWAAAAAMAYFVARWASVPFVIYPNKLAAFWNFPLLLAFAFRAARPEAGWRAVACLAAGSLIVGQIHGLYAIYASMVLTPLVVIISVHRTIADRRIRWTAIAYPVALNVGLLFSWITVNGLTTKSQTASDQAAESSPTAADYVRDESEFDVLENGNVVLAKGLLPVFSSNQWRLKVAAPLLAAMIVLRLRRREAVMMSIVLFAGASLLLFPPLCTVFVETFRRPWMVLRFGMMIWVPAILVVSGVPVLLIEAILRGEIGRGNAADRPWRIAWNRAVLFRRAAESAVVLLMFFIAIAIRRADRTADDVADDPNGWIRYIEVARSPRDERLKTLDGLLDLGERLDRLLEPGDVVVAAGGGKYLTAVYDCHLVAPQQASVGVSDLAERRIARKNLLSAAHGSDRTIAIRKYGASHAVVPASAIRPGADVGATPLFGKYVLVRLESAS